MKCKKCGKILSETEIKSIHTCNRTTEFEKQFLKEPAYSNNRLAWLYKREGWLAHAKYIYEKYIIEVDHHNENLADYLLEEIEELEKQK